MARVVFPVTVASNANNTDGWIPPSQYLSQYVTALQALNFPASFTTSDVTFRVREVGQSEEYTVKNFSLSAAPGDSFGADDLAKMSAYVKSYEWQLQFATPQAADTQVVLTVD